MVFFITGRNFAISALAVLSLLRFGEAKNPSQFCHRDKKLGIDSCLAFFTLLNISTAGTDFYITIETNRFESNKLGWNAFGFGNQMKGALMFITYGDPTEGSLTTSVRSAEGHHPPTRENLVTMSGEKPLPEIIITADKSGPYIGPLEGEDRPSHSDRKHIICYGCDHWAGTEVDGHSTAQPFVWAVNAVQDFSEDASEDAHVDMHGFGSGFGVFWADLTKSRMFSAIFGRINRLYLAKDTTQIRPVPTETPEAPPEEEATQPPVDNPPATGEEENSNPGVPAPPDAPFRPENPHPPAAPPPPTVPPSNDNEDAEEEAEEDASDPTRKPTTWRGKTLKDWMWHLHGLFMAIVFLALYPLGALLVRAADTRAFNFHWTTQALASILAALGAAIALTQSRSVSVPHQYLGLALLAAVALQILLGWRHHVGHRDATRSGSGSGSGSGKTWFSAAHVYLGRGVLGAGYVNLVLGMQLRGYGWATMAALILAIAAEVFLLVYMMKRLKRAHREEGGSARPGRNTDAQLNEADEYFQLVGDDDDDNDDYGWSDDEPSDEAVRAKQDKAKRLAKLDAV